MTWLAPWVANKSLARSKDGLGGQTFTYPENPTDEAIEPISRAAGKLAGAQGAGACLRARARSESARRHRGIAQALHGADADRLGHGRYRSSRRQARTISTALLPNSRGVRRIEGAKLFFPEEFPDVIAEEARKLWAAG